MNIAGLVLAAMLVTAVLVVGYSTTSERILLSHHQTAKLSLYGKISEKDLERILDEASLRAAQVGAENGWSDSQVEDYFRNLSNTWIDEYLRERGVYDVEIVVAENSSLDEESGETVIQAGRYLLEVRRR